MDASTPRPDNPLPDNPLIVQADRSLLVDTHAPRYEEVRALLSRFAELEKSPEHMHTYRLSPLALWNAAASGLDAATIAGWLNMYCRYPVPQNVAVEIRDLMSRYGKLKLEAADEPDRLVLTTCDPALYPLIAAHKTLGPMLTTTGTDRFTADGIYRGRIKQQLLKLGYPVDDRAGFTPGAALSVRLRAHTLAGQPFVLRDYQREAATSFVHGAGSDGAGGHGVVVLPCGAGKTVVAMAAMAEVGMETLVLATSVTAARQWIRELLDKTEITEDQIGEYSGDRKQIRPVTVATYQILTHKKGTRFSHFETLAARGFGLLIYDEVHLLPAPVFRLTAEIQARRRLGLTATLVREDGQEGEVFSLIGPKRYDAPWKQLEAQGFIAEASCYELRVPMSDALRVQYDTAEPNQQHRLAATNPIKVEEAARLLAQHPGQPTLVIGTYLDQLAAAAKRLGAPIITGETPQRERERILKRFREGQETRLVLSRVGNFSIDLPDASLCVQLSGTFGSRQEEAQRLGRILRPKANGGSALFYSLVSRDTVEQRFAMNRQLFLTEQGYRYYIEELGIPAASEAAALPGREETRGAQIIPFPRPVPASAAEGATEP